MRNITQRQHQYWSLTMKIRGAQGGRARAVRVVEALADLGGIQATTTFRCLREDPIFSSMELPGTCIDQYTNGDLAERNNFLLESESMCAEIVAMDPQRCRERGGGSTEEVIMEGKDDDYDEQMSCKNKYQDTLEESIK